MSTHNIHIRAGNQATENLMFEGRTSQRVPAASAETVEWHTQHNSGPDSIEAFKERIPVKKVWATQPTNQGRHWENVPRATARESEYYVYYIRSRSSEHVRIYNPLLAIRTSHPLCIIDIVLKAILKVIVGTMAGFLYWKKKRMKLKQENEILRKESERLKLNQG